MCTGINMEEAQVLEGALARRWRDHRDAAARGELLRALQPLVERLARRYADRACPGADLVQEGNLGALQAIDRFDPDRGIRLSTYAAWWIRAHMLRFVERNRGLVRGATTRERARLFYGLSRATAALRAEGLEPTAEALAERLDTSVEDVVAMQALAAPARSLDTPAAGEDTRDDRCLPRVVDARPTPEDAFASGEFADTLASVLAEFEATLDERAKEMFRERVTSTQPCSLTDLGVRWGITRAAARRVEERVTRPLRRFLYEQLGDSIYVTLGAA